MIHKTQNPCITSVRYSKSDTTKMKAILEKDSIWKSGTTDLNPYNNSITITFGTYKCKDCTKDAAWSLIGNKSNKEKPSMNLGYVDPPLDSFTYNNEKYDISLFKDDTRNYYSDYPSEWKEGTTILHEFCHALGMLHEHQNNLGSSNKLHLNVGNIITYYVSLGYPRTEAKDTANTNVVNKYNCNDNDVCNYIGSDYDPESIMLYALPDDWVVGKNPTKPNFKLSKLDILWLSKSYPLISNYPIVKISFVDTDVPLWKSAWIKKVLTEQLIPHVCIGFVFVDNDGKITNIKPQNIIYKQISKKLKEKFDNIGYNSKVIIYVILGLILLITLIFILTKKFMK